MPRRILIANAGNPRIITEALWALKMHRDWVPAEIHVFTNRDMDAVFRDALAPSDSGQSKLLDVCSALKIVPPHLKLHLASEEGVEGRDRTLQPIHLLKEQWETDALNKLFDKELVPLLVDDQTEVVCLARSGLGEMQILMSYYAVALMRPGRDHWYSVFIQVQAEEGAEQLEVALQRDPDFWYPRDISTDGRRLSRRQIQIQLKGWDYGAMKRTVSERQFRNPGQVQELIIDAPNQKLTVRANAVMTVDVGSRMNVFVLQTLANMYQLRSERYSVMNTEADLSDAFFEHIDQIRTRDDGARLLPVDDVMFVPSLRTLIGDQIARHVLADWFDQNQPLFENESIDATMELEDVEHSLAGFFYKDPATAVGNFDYWWRKVPAFMWKWEKRLVTPLARGRVKQPAVLNFTVDGCNECDEFVRQNWSSQEKVGSYIATNIFSLTDTGTYQFTAERSAVNKPVRDQLPSGSWRQQLLWDKEGLLMVDSQKIKFAPDGFLKQALGELKEDPNTRFDGAKIDAFLLNIDNYLADV